ncbi:zinc finger protein 234 isoform X3 [Bicyclus anynana]|uniref:Zinc finger protein 234 isoform X3 n=1 Tax=Bicyclus anynana TaxID=110368 RepID=A0ABM3M4B0_BICAN|nr:zinc finger protein 234 isoform X3 [Bicyclus anynana]
MRCCVPFCCNSSKNTSTSQGITYHRFPLEPGPRNSWLQALNKDAANLPARAAVCSQHFMYDDFYVTKSGMRKVRPEAVPLVIHVCLICLDTDRKMYPLSKYQLKEPYQILTGFVQEHQDMMPSTLCSECAHRLVNFSKFRDKSMRALSLMLDLIKEYKSQCGEYECAICKTHFKHPHALRKHITAHHTQRFSCNSCAYVTTHRQTARLHERWHKGTKYQCPHCPDEFVKFTTYMGHIRIKHPSDFVCELCGYSFVSEKGIDLHKKLKHRLDDRQIPEDGPLCEPCNVRFVSEAAYKRHRQVSTKHNSDDKDKGKRKRELKEKKPECGERNERRMYPSQIRKAEGPISCEQCGMQLEDSRAYHGHFRRHHPDKNRTKYPSMKSPFMCESCGRMFQSYALLKDHRWVHTGERPFACDSCGKSFRMKQRLVAHRRVHSQVRATYVCGLCGKSFSTHSNRQRHMVIHTGLKPFKCEMCGKCFKHSSEKRAHVTYVHLKKPWPKRARGKRRQDRPGQMQAQGVATAGVSEMDIGQQVWAACEPKHHNMNMMDDKPLYYNNIKI